MIELRQYQADGLTAIWDYFKSGKTGNPLLCWPTGTGKSIVPAIFIRDVMKIWPTQRFGLLTHVSTLIEQNANVMKFAWPEAPLGIYSAGLKSKDTAHPIIYAGIQSAIKNPSIFGHRDIYFIDEAHLVSQEESSQYLTFLATAKLINPHLKIIGLTATPFRMGMGMITDGGLFTDIVHDLTSLDNFNKLIAEGYLAPLAPLRTKVQLDISGVGFNKGEFIASQLQNAVDIAEITFSALKEAVAAGENRKSWLIFASGIEHADHIAEQLVQFGISCMSVHSKQTTEHNEKAIKAFKNFELRAIANYGKLTTGFDHPSVDLIIMLRPTMSVPLWVQMLGRGTRPAEGKKDCLVLDFGKNSIRLGPINDPVIPNKKGEKPGQVPIKICEQCGVYNHTKVRFCTNCGAEFSFQIKIVEKSGTEELLRNDAPIVEMFDVTYVIYAKKQKKDKGVLTGSPYILATYFCNMQSFGEFVFPEGRGPAKHEYHKWWQQRIPIEAPPTTDEALKYISNFRKPARIRVWTNRMVAGKNYPKVMGAEF